MEEFTFKLDPTKKPKTFDFQQRRNAKQSFPGIYLLKGDELKICFRFRRGSQDEMLAPEKPERPTAFADYWKTGSYTALLILKRQRKPDAKKDEKPRPDKERLQGTWKVVSTVDDGEEAKEEDECWTIKDKTIRVQSKSRRGEETTNFLRFRLEETTNPRLMDVVEGEANDLFDTAEWDKRFEDADQRLEGIYSLAGDTLTICLSRNKGDRPTTFESKQGSDYILVVLKREE